MTKSERLQPVTRIAELRERNAAKALGQSRHRLSETEARLAELLAYREEYARRLQTSGGEGMNAREVSEYQLFLARLNDAIAHQQARLAQAHQDYESRRTLWQSQRTHTLALDKVVERYRHQEARAAAAGEQRESDDRTRTRGNDER